MQLANVNMQVAFLLHFLFSTPPRVITSVDSHSTIAPTSKIREAKILKFHISGKLVSKSYKSNRFQLTKNKQKKQNIRDSQAGDF